ncbi:hypothetical protein [Botryobacter ruber]|nr:hypothetical protein [Botryobacter ruber]
MASLLQQLNHPFPDEDDDEFFRLVGSFADRVGLLPVIPGKQPVAARG